jgi:hypothetical protein
MRGMTPAPPGAACRSLATYAGGRAFVKARTVAAPPAVQLPTMSDGYFHESLSR